MIAVVYFSYVHGFCFNTKDLNINPQLSSLCNIKLKFIEIDSMFSFLSEFSLSNHTTKSVQNAINASKKTRKFKVALIKIEKESSNK